MTLKSARFFLASALCALTSSSLRANVVGVDTQNFNTITSGLDFVTVHSSETLVPGVINLGLFLNYGVNTLPFYSKAEGTEESRLGRVRDALSAGDLNFGLGLTENWDVGISFPFIIDQTIKSDDDRGQFDDRGLTEVRLNSKLRFVGGRTGGVAGILSVNFNTIDNNPFVGEGGGPIVNFELAGDMTLFRRLAVGANVGYRLRNPGSQNPEFPIEPTKDQIIASFATSYLVRSIDSKIIFETFGSFAADTSESQVDRNESSAESLLGLKVDASPHLALHVGGGTELSHAVASPDWRAYAGLNYTIGPVWGDDDQRQVSKRRAKKSRSRSRSKKPLLRRIPPTNMMGLGDVTEIADEPEVLPEPVAAGQEYPSDADETFVLDDIHFAFDSDYRALPGAKRLLQGLASLLKKRNFQRLVVEGHTDSLGSKGYNIDLGARRAVTVKNFLVREFGLERSKIKTITYGESRPIGQNGNYQGRQLNRRVVFRVYYDKSKLPSDGW